MKITSFYYMSYPDSTPADPLTAASEVYVEVAKDNGSIKHFDSTYSFMVCTLNYIKTEVDANSFYANRSLIVVDCFDDRTIEMALEAVLANIDAVGTKK